MNYFSFDVSPSRNPKKIAGLLEPVTLTLVPFEAKTVVEFDDIPVGETAGRTIRIINPSNKDIDIVVNSEMEPEYNVVFEWEEHKILAKEELNFKIFWTPLRQISSSKHLYFSYQKWKKDVVLIFKSQQLSCRGTKTSHLKKNKLKPPTTSNLLSKALEQSCGRPPSKNNLIESKTWSALIQNSERPSKVPPISQSKSINSKAANRDKDNYQLQSFQDPEKSQFITKRSSSLTERNIYVKEDSQSCKWRERKHTKFTNTDGAIDLENVGNKTFKIDKNISLQDSNEKNNSVLNKTVTLHSQNKIMAFTYPEEYASCFMTTPVSNKENLYKTFSICEKSEVSFIKGDLDMVGTSSGTYASENIVNSANGSSNVSPIDDNIAHLCLIDFQEYESCEESKSTNNEPSSPIKSGKSEGSSSSRLCFEGGASIFPNYFTLQNGPAITLEAQSHSWKPGCFLPPERSSFVPQKNKFGKPVKLYDMDWYQKSYVNPDPFAASTNYDPFLTSSIYLDDEAVMKHRVVFKKWLNALVRLPVDLDADCNPKIDVGKLFNQIRNKDVDSTPTIGEQSINFLAQYRTESIQLFMSDELKIPCSKVAVYINKNAIRIRNDRNLHLDVVMQRNILELLLGFNPLWLRLGLEVIYGEEICLSSNNDVVGLSAFILNRLFRGKSYGQKVSKACMMSEKYADAVKKQTLTKFLFLLLFLDKAKTSDKVKLNLCLFNKKSPYKETKEILLRFSSELLANVGDITRELKRLGYVLQHKQAYIEEFDYTFNNIAIDLRDGVRLAKVMEIILLRDDLIKQLRVPAISRLQKIYNVDVALNALNEAEFHLDGGINAADIVDGHREKTLSLLWQIIYKFRSPKFQMAAAVLQKWWRKSWLKVFIRRNILYKEELKQNRAATIIQAKFRGLLARRFVAWYKEKTVLAATILQKYVRRFLARKAFMVTVQSIKKIQNWYRACRIARPYRLEFIRLKSATMVVQHCYRNRRLSRWLLKSAAVFRFLMHQKRKEAANVIQTLWWYSKLGKIHRGQFLEIRKMVLMVQVRFRTISQSKENRNTYLLLRRAATKVQSYFRNYRLMKLNRTQYLKKRNLIATLQINRRAHVAMLKERTNFLQDRFFIISLQQSMRALIQMKRQRMSYFTIKLNVVRIQCFYRARLEMNKQVCKYHDSYSKISLIQRQWRNAKVARQVRKEFNLLKWATSVTQHIFLAQQQMRKFYETFQRLKQSAIYSQSQYRALKKMLITRVAFLNLCEASKAIQTFYKAFQQMKYYRGRFLSWRSATCRVQSCIRAYWQMKHDRFEFLRRKETAFCLQKLFSAVKLMQKARKRYLDLREASLNAQNYYRAMKSMQNEYSSYSFKRECIITSQRIFQAQFIGRRIRAKYLCDRYKVLNVQILFRAKLQMLEGYRKYRDLRLTIVSYQKVFKAYLAMRDDRLLYLSRRKALIYTQKWCKNNLIMKQDRLEYQEKRKLIIFLQRKFKAKIVAVVQRMIYLDILSKIKALQKIWTAILKMHIARTTYQGFKYSSIVVQKRYRAHLLMLEFRNHYLLEKSLIHSVQTRFRSFFLMKKQKAEFLGYRQLICYCQRIFRSKLLMLKEHQKFCLLKVCMVGMQARCRGVLARRYMRYLMTPEMQEKRSRNKAAKIIQRSWKGYNIRKRFQNNDFKRLRKNISQSISNANSSNSVKNKIQDGINILKGRSNLTEIWHVLIRLDKISRIVPHMLVNHFDFISTFCYGVMAQAIRSEIDKQLIEHCCRIILNLARYNSKTANAFQVNGLVTIAPILLRWCDKDSDIFNTLCTLIWIFAQCPKKRRIIHKFMSTPEAIYLLRETKKLVARKEKMNQNLRNNLILTKNSKNPFPKDTLPSLDPDYGVVQNQAYTFISSVFAFDTIISALGITNL